MKKLFIFLLLVLPLRGGDAPASVAAEKFLTTLDAAQKAQAVLPFTSEERENFRYTPRVRAGLPLGEMTATQREAALVLLASALSEKAQLKAEQIMELEKLLAEIENNPTRRDSRKYYVAVFGTPGDVKGWGWRFEGHHLSVNLTLMGEKVISVTPSFLGANPAEVRSGGKKGLRVLAAEEDMARALVSELLVAGKSAVIYTQSPPREILTGEQRNVTALEPVGILAADMTDGQRAALLTLISEYIGRHRADLAEVDMAKIQAAGFEKIRFGWAGSTQPGQAYYYRIQGPTFIMEGANTQNQANHLHAVWRDFNGDFGRDLLREHLSGDH